MESLRHNIKKYRRLGGFLQEEIAEKLGIKVARYSTWETGKAEPSVDNMIKLCNIYGISLDELCGLEPKKDIDEIISNTSFFELWLMIKVMDPDKQELALKLAKKTISLVDEVKK